MGDRGNIKITQYNAFKEQDEAPLYLYTHWTGSRVCQDLAKAILKGRTFDSAYFTRTVFQVMTQRFTSDDELDTGFGIAVGQEQDNEHEIPHVYWKDGKNQEMRIDYCGATYTAEEFVKFFGGFDKAPPSCQGECCEEG